ncbi:hypothetical protein SAMN05444920_101616 [Nonomuraea solani]|uniref:Uncharacterized protein n=1 Tax=Nonomuraea solani TaxID=1144553 RepID=A0A1H5USY9_9ACTN|nr:hypothetical protein [Nonomuraea solani]SEF77551.1 hypothetical protein SAMN05444920_101616 [Nonomuraea solani]
MANAFRASHPEYVVSSESYAFERRPDEMAIVMNASHNQQTSGVVQAFGIRQDQNSGGFSYATGDDRHPVRLEEALRRLDAPESQALSAALRRVGRDGGPMKEEVDAALRKVGRSNEVTAVVELARPLTANEIRDRKHLPVDNGIFSPALGGAPVYWDIHSGTFCKVCGGGGDQITQDFRNWVGSLGPSDGPGLQYFGLILPRLKDVARAGKIYGYIQHAEDPVLLRKLLKQKYVKSMYIVRVADHCADEMPENCSWPGDRQLYG